MIYTTSETMRSIRTALREGKGEAAISAEWLKSRAESSAARPTACITDHPSPAVSGDPHDYFSEGPYWWPDPANPGGRYIRRDGVVNPERFHHHAGAFGQIFTDSLLLALSAYHLGNTGHLAVLYSKLDAFFLNPATRMNPNMNHAQAIRGISNGRGIGIIEAVGMHRLIFAMELLREMNEDNPTIRGMYEWLRAFYTWLRTSENGLSEKRTLNNHSMWYTSITIALARLLDDAEGFAADCDYYGELMQIELTDEGAFRDEITRTNALSYCCFNLSAAASICEIAHFAGVDLWNRSYGTGRSMADAVRWLAPFLIDPSGWQYQQINGKTGDAPTAIYAASVRLTDPEARDAALRVLDAAKDLDPRRAATPVGPTEYYFCR